MFSKTILCLLVACLLIQLSDSAPTDVTTTQAPGNSSSNAIPADAQLRRKRQSSDPNQSDSDSNSNENPGNYDQNEQGQSPDYQQGTNPVLYSSSSSGQTQRKRRQTINGADGSGYPPPSPPVVGGDGSGYPPTSPDYTNTNTDGSGSNGNDPSQNVNQRRRRSGDEKGISVSSNFSKLENESTEGEDDEAKKNVEVLIVPVVIQRQPIIIVEQINSDESLETTTTSDSDSTEDDSSSSEDQTVTPSQLNKTQDSDSDLVDPNDDKPLKMEPPSLTVNVLSNKNQSGDDAYDNDLNRRERRDTPTESPKSDDEEPRLVEVVKIIRFVILNNNDTDDTTTDSNEDETTTESLVKHDTKTHVPLRSTPNPGAQPKQELKSERKRRESNSRK